MASLKVPLIFVAIASIAFGNSEAGGYKQINDYLVKNVDVDEISSNMKAASRWLNNAAERSRLTRVQLSDLKKFTDLQLVIEDTKCDHSAYEILRANEEAVGLHKLSNRKNQMNRRVDKVMLKVFENHAHKCSKVYPLAYHAKREQFDEVIFERVENLGAFTMKAKSYKSPSSLYSEYIENYPSFRDFEESRILDVILSNAKNNPDVRYMRTIPHALTDKEVLYKDKIKGLFLNYLIEPCQQYIAKFGPDVFIPARFDSQISIKIDNSLDYFRGWAYFMICQEVTSKENAIFNELVLSVAERI